MIIILSVEGISVCSFPWVENSPILIVKLGTGVGNLPLVGDRGWQTDGVRGKGTSLNINPKWILSEHWKGEEREGVTVNTYVILDIDIGIMKNRAQ